MPKLSENNASKEHLEKKFGKESHSISDEMQKQLELASLDANKKIELNNAGYNQSNSHSSETIVCENTQAKKFVDNIDKMRNPHIRDCVSLEEKYGSIEDYSEYQEQRDLENYKHFINSQAYDDLKEAESEIGEQLTLSKLRKISSMHDD